MVVVKCSLMDGSFCLHYLGFIDNQNNDAYNNNCYNRNQGNKEIDYVITLTFRHKRRDNHYLRHYLPGYFSMTQLTNTSLANTLPSTQECQDWIQIESDLSQKGEIRDLSHFGLIRDNSEPSLTPLLPPLGSPSERD